MKNKISSKIESISQGIVKLSCEITDDQISALSSLLLNCTCFSTSESVNRILNLIHNLSSCTDTKLEVAYHDLLSSCSSEDEKLKLGTFFTTKFKKYSLGCASDFFYERALVEGLDVVYGHEAFQGLYANNYMNSVVLIEEDIIKLVIKKDRAFIYKYFSGKPAVIVPTEVIISLFKEWGRFISTEIEDKGLVFYDDDSRFSCMQIPYEEEVS